MKAPWKLLHLDLGTDPLPTLEPIPGYEGIRLGLWWQGIPLNHLHLSSAELPLSPTALSHQILKYISSPVGDRLFEQGFQAYLPMHYDAQTPPPDPRFPALSHFLATQFPLTDMVERVVPHQPEKISVIVCTRDRPEALARCLRSLQALSALPHEILVVDNAPRTDATRTCVATFPGVTYLCEPTPGLSVARNTGIRHATGTLIAFTDDDVVVHPHWLRQIQGSFAQEAVMAATGLMLPAELEHEAQCLFQYHFGGPDWDYRAKTFDSQFFTNMQSRGVPTWLIGAGANMAFRRDVFHHVGLFDESLGAGASGCSEDSELWYRILAAGGHCYYDPTAVVFHYHRADLESLNQQAFQYMRGHVTALLRIFAKYHHWGNLRRLSLALPKYYLQRIATAIVGRGEVETRTLRAEILGCFAGLFYVLRRASPS
jgi:GT2 family glycosyltransferase